MLSPHTEAHRLFFYDEKSGKLIHRVTRGKAVAGMVAGYVRKNGYVTMNFIGRKIDAHRIIWLMKTGKFPTLTIDHIDRNPTNNKWENLREATTSQQAVNTKMRSNNTSGWRGVRKTKGKWQALISTGGKQTLLGSFLTPEEASLAYHEAAKVTFGEFYNK